MKPILLISSLSLLLACTPEQEKGDSSPPVLEESSGTLTTENSAGRHGAFFLPERVEGAATPLLVAYHGTGGEGAVMINAFTELAREWGFAIVAPDSRVSPDGQFTWEVGNHAGEVTEDYTHTLACIAEVTDDWVIDSEVLATGFSGGASSAPYIATNESLFTALSVLHGGVIGGGIGENIIRGWFSTGEDDSVRSPEHVQSQMETLQALGFDDLELHLYPGGHQLGGEERSELISWWLR